MKVDQPGKSVCRRSQGNMGLGCRRPSPGNDCRARAACQSCLGRLRLLHPLHNGDNLCVQDLDPRARLYPLPVKGRNDPSIPSRLRSPVGFGIRSICSPPRLRALRSFSRRVLIPLTVRAFWPTALSTYPAREALPADFPGQMKRCDAQGAGSSARRRNGFWQCRLDEYLCHG